MKRRTASCLLALCLAALPGRLAAQEQDADPFVWLEEVEGSRAMDWVRTHNDATLAALSREPVFQSVYDRTLRILNSSERIASPSLLGERIYNFWQDAEHPRGVWRRTSWAGYLSGRPQWEVVLDIDSLARAEQVNWSFGGSTCLAPDYHLCLVRLSRGGSDAAEVREFDTRTRRFVEGGFRLPAAKQSVAWRDPDHILVATDFGDGSLTTSGYARIAKLWRRGTPLADARTLFEGKPGDVRVGVGSVRTADRSFQVVSHSPSFFESTTYILEGDRLVEMKLPLDADAEYVRDQLLVYLRSPWEVGGRTHAAGSLISIRLADFLAGRREFQTVLQPGPRATIQGISATRDFLLVTVLENVRSQLWRYRYQDGRWTSERIPTPQFGSVGIAATSPLHNRYFYTSSGYTQPTTLYLVEEDGRTREVRRLPAMFQAEGLVVEQNEATSRDGTRVPYFVVRRQDARLDGRNPTLLYGYGGFEISMTPGYNATTGAAWLERGGVYVVANIRGGGEFGPTWHRAALKQNRQRAYDDFIAVAEDLIARRITSPDHLGIMGGSNGGLLVGAAFTQRPDLFDAVVVQVPLLDMRRYNRLLAGASWMAEYGDPDKPEEWAFIQAYSPYHNLKPGAKYPRVLFTTTTRDDRVHPGHARKMAAKMESMGYPVYYFENTEGGHGAGVTNEQRARMQAVVFAYLWKQLAAGS